MSFLIIRRAQILTKHNMVFRNELRPRGKVFGLTNRQRVYIYCTMRVRLEYKAMAFLNPQERSFSRSIVQLAYCNPFLPERIEHERTALGSDFDESQADWNLHGDKWDDHANVTAILRRGEQLVDKLRKRLSTDVKPTPEELQLYEDLALFVLYNRFRKNLSQFIELRSKGHAPSSLATSYDRFQEMARRLLHVPRRRSIAEKEIAHLFACFFQIKRAFHYIFRNIIGVSSPAARFRAAAWQSIFTHHMRRYRNVMYNQMADITTLITGPSGTGKELAARAIGMARYIPFDPKKAVFAEDYLDSFHAVNLSALSPTLIESELFGHVHGSFTGAVKDRVGWFEDCTPTGTVFLDEIGDVDPAIQVKLLRVLQARVFQRIGDTTERSFRGKAIAATNRNLAEQMHAGQFREDLYYRLCGDMIVAPSLGERLRDKPEELHTLVLFVAKRLIGDEAVSLTEEAVSYIEQHIGMTYAWPGNVRELEQCVRNILIRGEYQARRQSGSPERELTRQFAEGSLTVDELIGRYCTLVYAQTGSYQETARRLGVDRRTIKTRVDPQLLESLRSRHSGEDLD